MKNKRRAVLLLAIMACITVLAAAWNLPEDSEEEINRKD